SETSDDRRQRWAQKPRTLTAANRTTTMTNSVTFISAPPLGLHEDEGGHRGREQRETDLEPEEERETPELGLPAVVDRDQQRQNEGDQQQPVPGAVVALASRRGGRQDIRGWFLRVGGCLRHHRLLLDVGAVTGCLGGGANWLPGTPGTSG